jgi:hypothetical protein
MGLLLCVSAIRPAQAQQGMVLDRVAAIVNSELILESDVDEEMRFAALQPYRVDVGELREVALNRLVDRTLILQQEKMQPQIAVSDDAVRVELQQLRQQIPACKRYDCASDEGWRHFLSDNGFTEAEVEARWKQRMDVLRFIEVRFRSGARITQPEIQDYYKQTLLPEYEKEKVKPPPLDSVSDRIQEVLLAKKVNSLLDEWLKSLRDQGSVRILKPGEEAP